MINTLRQTLALTLAGVRGIPQRLGSSLVTVIGIMTVSAVLVSLLSMGEGAQFWSGRDARADRAVVLSKGAPAAPLSRLTRETVAAMVSAPGIQRDPAGHPLLSASTMASVDVIKKTHERGNIFLVGMTNVQVYPEIRIRSGRYFRSGLHEVIVSQSAQAMYSGLEIGNRIPLRGAEWTVVGVFEDTGGSFDSVLFADGETMLSAFGRNAFQEVVVLLDSPSRFESFKAALIHDQVLDVDVYTDAQSRAMGMANFRGLLDFVSYFIGAIMASGAICAALSSLYAAVDARRHEIATLRAIGFGSGPVATSILAEGIALALPAALAGALVAWLLFNGKVVSTRGLTFPLAVTPHLLLVSIVWALGTALIGGVLPAIRAARVPVAAALRAT